MQNETHSYAKLSKGNSLKPTRYAANKKPGSIEGAKIEIMHIFYSTIFVVIFSKVFAFGVFGGLFCKRNNHLTHAFIHFSVYRECFFFFSLSPAC